MTTGLYMLRCYQIGLRLSDLEQLNFGDVMDMLVEYLNDDAEYAPVATQEDFDAF